MSDRVHIKFTFGAIIGLIIAVVLLIVLIITFGAISLAVGAVIGLVYLVLLALDRLDRWRARRRFAKRARTQVRR